ncbi:hypothetical protein RB653_000383 [Dictyostelium firmibasis]|uniref:rRNA adenine N(6)-methyltransferase n=1 Tax=Dictyostelium firmibasis TaxID=79012 RepID=A0AAN7TWK3_9MYCE
MTIKNIATSLPPMPKIQEIIRIFGLSAKQQLSQNFLIDKNITDKICKRSGGFNDCTVIEVGAGPGGLTRSLLTSGAKKVIAVEMDPRFYPALKMLEESSEGRMQLIMANMMDVDEAKILREAGAEISDWKDKSKVKIIGNLPFNVGTHLMLKWIRQIAPRQGLYEFGRVPMYLMFQKELSNRICAQVGTEEYSRLSVMVQQITQPSIVYEIPGSAFVPPPKVDASVVAIEPRIKPLGDEPIKDHHYFEFICRELFSQRRKKLSNTIKTLGKDAEKLLGDDIDPTIRPQNLKIEQFVKIANRYIEFPNKIAIDHLEFENDGKAKRKEDKLKERMEKINTKIEKTMRRQEFTTQKANQRKEQKEKEKQEKLLAIQQKEKEEKLLDDENHLYNKYDLEDEIDNEMFEEDRNLLDTYQNQLKEALDKKYKIDQLKQKKLENKDIIDQDKLKNQYHQDLNLNKSYNNIDDIDIDEEKDDEDDEDDSNEHIDYDQFLNEHFKK